MSMNYPLGDMLARIKNAHSARLEKAEGVPASRLKQNVLDVLQREGYIRGYVRVEKDGHALLDVELKYFEGKPAIEVLECVSKPSRRIYSAINDLPRYMNGLGTSILSTPKGVLSEAEARAENVGGEVLCRVY
ncbi:MAG: 30S ribosomal protein S8 [Bdellovibrionales bacterium]